MFPIDCLGSSSITLKYGDCIKLVVRAKMMDSLMAKLPNVIKIGIKGNLLWDSSKNYL